MDEGNSNKNPKRLGFASDLYHTLKEIKIPKRVFQHIKMLLTF